MESKEVPPEGTQILIWVHLFEKGMAAEVGEEGITILATDYVATLRRAIQVVWKNGKLKNCDSVDLVVRPTRNGEPLKASTKLFSVEFERDTNNALHAYVEVPYAVSNPNAFRDGLRLIESFGPLSPAAYAHLIKDYFSLLSHSGVLTPEVAYLISQTVRLKIHSTTGIFILRVHGFHVDKPKNSVFHEHPLQTGSDLRGRQVVFKVFSSQSDCGREFNSLCKLQVPFFCLFLCAPMTMFEVPPQSVAAFAATELQRAGHSPPKPYLDHAGTVQPSFAPAQSAQSVDRVVRMSYVQEAQLQTRKNTATATTAPSSSSSSSSSSYSSSSSSSSSSDSSSGNSDSMVDSRWVLVMPDYGPCVAELAAMAQRRFSQLSLSAGCALFACHAAGYCFVDMKPANLVSTNYGCCLVDGGSIRPFGEILTLDLVTPHYCMSQQLVASSKFDMACLASTLLEIGTLQCVQTPYHLIEPSAEAYTANMPEDEAKVIKEHIKAALDQPDALLFLLALEPLLQSSPLHLDFVVGRFEALLQEFVVDDVAHLIASYFF